jgi:hypothetical protein
MYCRIVVLLQSGKKDTYQKESEEEFYALELWRRE